MSAAVHITQEPTKGSHHNRDFVLQKYLLLEEQHESLRQHLDQLRPVNCASSPSASPTRCPLTASSSVYGYWPPQGQTTAAQYQYQPRRHSRSSSISSSPQQSSSGFAFAFGGGRRGSAAGSSSRSGSMAGAPAPAPPFGLETVPDESTLHEVAEEEAKLCDVNEGIKRALTELLNCEAVRADRALRTWVQCRLMETEKELRTGRRRRSAPGMEH